MEPRQIPNGNREGLYLRKLAEGREAEIFEWNEGRVLRLLREPGARMQNLRQAAALAAARADGVRVPEVRGAVEVMGRPGLVMERIAGVDLLTMMGLKPWLSPRVGWILGKAHSRLHRIRAPEGIDTVKEMLRERITGSGAVPERLRECALAILEELPDGDRLCHGSFHPGNVMMEGRTPVVIDWSHSGRGDPAADVALTRLLLRLGQPPPGASWRVRWLAMAGRRALERIYVESYGRERRLDRGLVRRWEVVQAASRLTLGIQSERCAMLGVLRTAVLRAAVQRTAVQQ